MDTITNIIVNPVAWKVLLGYWVFNSATTALPLPDGNGAKFYQFLYVFFHSLAGNLDKAASAIHLPRT